MSKPFDLGKTIFDISINNDQIGMRFEADTPDNCQEHVYLLRLSDKDLVKKYWRATEFFGCSSITFKL